MTFTRFYDSAAPQNIPSGVYAAVYINGFAWPQDEVHRMRKIISISVLPEASWARDARVIDVENGAAGPGDVVPFIQERRRLGHDDAIAYVNRSNWPLVVKAVGDAGLEAHVRYWVATLGGAPVLQPGQCWAEQFRDADNAFDLSMLYGEDVFHRP